MKAARLLIAAPLLKILALVSAFQAFHGKTLFGVGYPLSQNWIDVSVKAAGGWIILAFVLALAGVVVYVCGLVKLLRTSSRGQAAAAK